MPAKNIGKTLKELRLKSGLTQKQAYEHIGVAQSTFSSWEVGKAEPPNDVFMKLCDLYNVKNILQTFGYDGYNEDGSLQLNIEEVDIIEKYRLIKQHSLDGKAVVDTVLDREYSIAEKLKEQAKQINRMDIEAAEEIVPMRLWAYYGKIACAGTGFIFDDIPTDTIEAPDANADFIIGVSGDSMEPDYYDGENLYIKKAERINPGEVGIFTINNECFLKEYGEHGLVSKNKKYDDIKENKDVRFIGKVVGKVEE